MKARIEFEIRCIDREFIIELENESDISKSEHIMSAAYDNWCENPEDVGDSCCEEYICKCLKDSGIEFTWIEGE